MSSDALLIIAGMAVIMYATRASGFWLIGRFTPSARTNAMLDQLASVTLVALTAPAVFSMGAPGLAAAAAVGVVALRTGSVLVAMVVGMAVVSAIR